MLTALEAEHNQILITCQSAGKKSAVSLNDIIQIDMMAYYHYQQIRETAFDGEGQSTSAINYATNDTQTKIYTLTGHQESSLSSTAADTMEKSNMTLSDLNLMTEGTIPADCSLLIINTPQKDISEDETDYYTRKKIPWLLIWYPKKGGGTVF